MEVTKIIGQRGNQNRVNLHVDGKFYRGLDRIVAMKLGLKQGMTLTPYLVKKLESTQTQNSAWEYALRSLQRSNKSIKTLRKKLADKFDPQTVEETIDKLVGSQLIDDEKLARVLVERYILQEKNSRRQIVAKLFSKGIPEAIVYEAAAQINQGNEQISALKLARYKNRQLQGLSWQERFKKIGAYLARRGFNYQTIKQVVTPENLEAKKVT